MTEHAKAPWNFEGDSIYDNADCAGNPIAHVLSCAYDNDLNNIDARRIVACVNRLARFTTEQIEDPTVDLLGANDWFNRYEAVMREMQALRSNNGQLLAALEELIDMDVAYQRGPKVEQAVNAARAVISAAKGGATC